MVSGTRRILENLQLPHVRPKPRGLQHALQSSQALDYQRSGTSGACRSRTFANEPCAVRSCLASVASCLSVWPSRSGDYAPRPVLSTSRRPTPKDRPRKRAGFLILVTPPNRSGITGRIWTLPGQDSARVQLERTVHDQRVHVAECRMRERTWHSADDFESAGLPHVHCAFVRGHHEIELHAAKALRLRTPKRIFA